MGSPTRRRRSPSASSSPSSSRANLDLPFSSYISSLPPINSTKRVCYAPRFSETNLPPPEPVFTSPHIDLQRESSIPTRGNIIAAGSNVDEPALEDLHRDSNSLVAPTGHQWVDGRLNDLPDASTREANGLVHPDIFWDPTSGAQHCEQLGPQIVEAYEDCLRSSRIAFKRSFEEAGQHQRMRRHLQFEIAGACNTITTGNSLDSWRPENNYAASRLPESLHSSQQRGIFRNQPLVSYSPMLSHFSQCPARTPGTLTGMAGSTQHSGNSALLAPGNCGLPLNRVGRTASIGSDMIADVSIPGFLTTQENLGSLDLPEDLISGSSSSSVSRKILVQDNDSWQESKAVVGSSSAIFQPLIGSLFTSEVNDMSKGLNQSSARKTRKRATQTTESGKSKHCNCKRSRCLKLYCECFAAGLYCLDSCACSDCINKSEYKDMVQEIREQIESRNPLAFAPRIVNPDTGISLEDRNWTTPSSARHKRGCNCKKSMCMKKYCECYQAKVGCSDGCRCEGCRNSFGIKADRRAERWEVQSHGALKIGGADQFSSTWEGIADINQMTPLSHPHSGAGASSASSNPGDFPEVSHAEFYRGNNSQTPAGALHWSSSSNTLVPQLPGNEAPQELSSDSAQHALTKDDDTPKTLISSPNRSLKACSSNQEGVSPPHIQLKDAIRLRPISSLTYGQTIIMLGTPNAPPLTWYSNYKDGIHQIKSNPNDCTGNQ